MTVVDLLALALLTALSAAGTALSMRAAPWWSDALKKQKPLSCAVCMGFWSGLATSLGAACAAVATRWPDGTVHAPFELLFATVFLACWSPAIAVAAVVFRFVFPPDFALPSDLDERIDRHDDRREPPAPFDQAPRLD